jgi:hypothetical protein
MVLSYLTSMVTCHNYLFDHHLHHWQNSPFRAIAFLIRFCQLCSFLGITSSGIHLFGFRNNIFLQSKVVSIASNPQPEGPGLCIYGPQCQGGPVILPDTWLLLRRLLRLARLRWRNSTLPPRWESYLITVI